MTNIVTATSCSELLTDAGQVSLALGAAFEVWRRAGGGGPPLWSAQHLLEYPTALLPWAMVALYEPAANDFRVRFWGSQRASLFKRDPTNRLVSTGIPPPLGPKVLRECQEVRQRQASLIFHTRVETVRNGAYDYQKIRLPLRAADRPGVDVVMSFEDPALITRQIFKAWDAEPPPHID